MESEKDDLVLGAPEQLVTAKEESVEQASFSLEPVDLSEVKSDTLRVILQKLQDNIATVAKKTEAALQAIERLGREKDAAEPPVLTACDPPSASRYRESTLPSNSKSPSSGVRSPKKAVSPVKASTPLSSRVLRSSSRPFKPNPKYASEADGSVNSLFSTLTSRIAKRKRGAEKPVEGASDADKNLDREDELDGDVEVSHADEDDDQWMLSEEDEDYEADFFGISKSEMLKRVSRMTSAKPYVCEHIRLLSHVPTRLLLCDEITNGSVPVNKEIPQVRLTGEGVRVSFVVDLSNVATGDLIADGLGSWNAKGGKRSSMRKFFFDENHEKCDDVVYEFCVLRKRYVHSYCYPPNSVRKLIWQFKGFDQRLYRYALISYSIQSGARVDVHDLKRRRSVLPILGLKVDETMMDEAITKVTSSPVFKKQFIKKLEDLPLGLLLQPNIKDAPVCSGIPNLDISKVPPDVPLKLAFLVDIKECGLSRIGNDGLGCWNTSGGPRMSVRKTFFKWNKRRCEENEHDFVLFRRIFVHPNCTPEGGIRKFIWLIKVREGYGRFAVITYDICANVTVAFPVRSRPAKKSFSPESIIKRRLMEKGFAQGPSKARKTYGENATATDIWDESIKTPMLYSRDELWERMAQPSSRCYTEPYHNDEPFNLVFLADVCGSQTQCASCSVDFSRYPTPPEDIVIEHVERFWNPRTGSYSTHQMQKRYIHARIDCILSRYGYFTTVDFLAVSPEVRDRLDDIHLQYLLDEFQCTLE